MTNYSKLTSSASLLILLAGFMLSSLGCKKEAETIQPLQGEKYQQLNAGMRKLWSDHMHWTLATVEAYYHNTNALNSSLDRLLQNQKDIGAAIVPYYGQAAGDQLAALLTEHIQLAVPVLQAAKNNDQPAINTAVTNWNNNAKDIAAFLTTANPANWPNTATEPALLHHIEHTVDYSVKTLNNDYSGAQTAFELALNHMLELADTLSEGIARQFPDKF
jgi:hypothetical protein